MSQIIRILTKFKRTTVLQLIAIAVAVIKGMTGNAIFPDPPVDMKTTQAAVDDLNAAVAAQPNGGLAGTALKNNKQAALVVILCKLAHYVEDNCGGDVANVLSAGFSVASSNRRKTPLEKTAIVRIDFGNTTQLVVKTKPISRVRCYKVQSAAVGAGGVLGPWQSAGLFTNSRAMTITGLTPGTTYSIQVCAVGAAGPTD
jgi:Fibronectin type III domain